MATATKAKRKTDNAAKLLKFAREQAKTCQSWQELHNAVYGVGGKFGELMPDVAERTKFAGSDEFKAIAELITGLRGNGDTPDELEPASGKFVLRLPESMHAALAAEAKREGVSLNQLCVAKLAIQLRETVR